MPELETVNKRSTGKKLPIKVVSKLDTSVVNVVKWASEGRELFFEDGENFLELSTEAYKALPQRTKTRYDVAKNITLGNDVIGTVTNDIKGFELPFEVRPENPTSQLAVVGTSEEYDYHWSRPDKFEKHSREGWVVDHDPSVRTKYDESCSYKTVGGQKHPELLLLKRPKTLGVEKKRKAKESRDALVKRTQNNFRESAESLGVKAVIDPNNG